MTGYPQVRMDVVALIRFDVARVLRDVKTILALVFVLGSPIAATKAGASYPKVFMLLALFLPVLVGWSWGADLAQGRLVQIALARRSLGALFGSRFVALVLPLIIVVPLARLESAPIPVTAAAFLFGVHMIALGFCLATWLRSPESGWLSLGIAVAGVWLPLLFVMKQVGTAAVPLVLRWLLVAFLPQFANDFGLYTPSRLICVYASLAAVWIALALLALRRPETIDRRSND